MESPEDLSFEEIKSKISTLGETEDILRYAKSYKAEADLDHEQLIFYIKRLVRVDLNIPPNLLVEFKNLDTKDKVKLLGYALEEQSNTTGENFNALKEASGLTAAQLAANDIITQYIFIYQREEFDASLEPEIMKNPALQNRSKLFRKLLLQCVKDNDSKHVVRLLAMGASIDYAGVIKKLQREVTDSDASNRLEIIAHLLGNPGVFITPLSEDDNDYMFAEILKGLARLVLSKNKEKFFEIFNLVAARYGAKKLVYELIFFGLEENSIVSKEAFVDFLNFLNKHFEVDKDQVFLNAVLMFDHAIPEEKLRVLFKTFKFALFMKGHRLGKVLSRMTMIPTVSVQRLSAFMQSYVSENVGFDHKELGVYTGTRVPLNKYDLPDISSYGKKVCLLALLCARQERLSTVYRKIKENNIAAPFPDRLKSRWYTAKEITDKLGIHHLHCLVYLEKKAKDPLISNNDFQKSLRIILCNPKETRDFLTILKFAIDINSPLKEIAEKYIPLFSFYLFDRKEIKISGSIDFNYLNKLVNLYNGIELCQMEFPETASAVEKFKEEIKDNFEGSLNNNLILGFTQEEFRILKQSKMCSLEMQVKIFDRVELPEVRNNRYAKYSLGSRLLPQCPSMPQSRLAKS